MSGEPSYDFDAGSHTAKAHEYASALIDEAYQRKQSDEPVPAQERVDKADELCEAYYAQMEQMPPSAVLSRLAWYIVFDDMTDSHPDKMTREEYPIINANQLFRRADRHRLIDEIEYGGREHNGRRRTAFIDDLGSPQVRNSRMAIPYADENESFMWRDLIDSIIEGAKLTERQREIVSELFLKGRSQAEVSGDLGISRQMIHRHYTAAFDKMSEYARNIGKCKLS